MTDRRRSRLAFPPSQSWLAWIAACLIVAGAARMHAQDKAPVVLDSVVAVVNNQAILASDVNAEIRLSVLEPNGAGRGPETPQEALRRLISRALIRQQIREEDLQSTQPTAKDVDTRLDLLRRELPACVRQNCTTDDGWKAFLASHDLTEKQVRTYLRNRLEVLRFIEMRFRQGISISPEEIETYYRDTLVPQYSPGEPIPPLDQVSSRIEEILLQQHVNTLFSGWLDNLRKQGEVEVLDPALEAANEPSGRKAGSQ
jgi:peptidyl-prolyl cis-trans isomerase SurA